MKSDTILVLGACGTFGSELTRALRRTYGDNRVVAADVQPRSEKDAPYGQWEPLNKKSLGSLIDRFDISQVYIASEHQRYGGQPLQELVNLLEVAREKKIAKVFWPSSVAVFGSSAPRLRCPQHAPLNRTPSGAPGRCPVKSGCSITGTSLAWIPGVCVCPESFTMERREPPTRRPEQQAPCTRPASSPPRCSTKPFIKAPTPAL